MAADRGWNAAAIRNGASLLPRAFQISSKAAGIQPFAFRKDVSTSRNQGMCLVGSLKALALL
jgi:hypothetical protein